MGLLLEPLISYLLVLGLALMSSSPPLDTPPSCLGLTQGCHVGTHTLRLFLSRPLHGLLFLYPSPLCFLHLTLYGLSSTSGVHNLGLVWALGLWMPESSVLLPLSLLKRAPSPVSATSADGSVARTFVRAGDLGVTLHLGTAAFLQSNSLPFMHWELVICQTLTIEGF